MIEHEGRKYVLKTIRLKCLDCDTIFETSEVRRHHTICCACGNVEIDDGIADGGTINGDPARMEDYSIYITQEPPVLLLPQEVVTARHERIKRLAVQQRGTRRA